MSHYCDFCEMEHTSNSCYHPGRAKLEARTSERDAQQDEIYAVFHDHGKLCDEIRKLEVALEAMADWKDKEAAALIALEEKYEKLEAALAACKARCEGMRPYLEHVMECAKWDLDDDPGPTFHPDVPCTCGLSKLIEE